MSRIRPLDTPAVRGPCVLTIAGSDSGGGAGIQADSRTIQALGGFAATALTAVTAQNTRGVHSMQPVPARLVAAQIDAVMRDMPVMAIKTGLLSGPVCIRTIARTLERFPAIPVVVDPVLASTSGTRFLDDRGVAALLRELAPRSRLLTPNWPEAAILAGLAVASVDQAERAARVILERGRAGGVLVKGGHGRGRGSVDVLVTGDGSSLRLRHERIRTVNTHGTGCVLASAIATRLGFGDDLVEAVRFAGDFLNRALRAGRTERLGGGHGPAFSGLAIKSPSR